MDVSKINETLTNLFNMVLKLEEDAMKESDTHNLSITEVHTLVAVGTGRPRTMTQVAGILKISVSTLTTAINKLVKKGYVSRLRDPEDRRIVKIRLTDMGMAAVTEYEQFRNSMIRDALSYLSKKEALRFAASIENINEFFLMRRAIPARKQGTYELKPISLGDMQIPVPVFQGGMSIGIAGGRLAGAVAACGGVGVVSATHAGAGEPDFKENPLEANKRAIVRELEKAFAIANEAENRGPIGVNIMASMKNYEEYVKAAIDAGAEIIISGAGLPTALPAIARNKSVKLVPVVASVRAARIIIKNWAKKYNYTPDAIIFEGPLAGGQLGFKEAQIDSAQETFYTTIAELKSELENIPECKLIVGGGIFTKKDCEKVLTCGADGVLVGSRFVTTEECDAPESFKQAYISCRKGDFTIIKTPMGMPARVLKNAAAEKILAGEYIPHECNECLSSCSGEEAQFCLVDLLMKAQNGDVDNGLVFCGTKSDKITKVETVKDVMESLHA